MGHRMTLAQLNQLLSPKSIQEAVNYASVTGAIHHKKEDQGSEGSIRRVCLHINDDGTSYLVLHGTLFEGAEHNEK